MIILLLFHRVTIHFKTPISLHLLGRPNKKVTERRTWGLKTFAEHQVHVHIRERLPVSLRWQSRSASLPFKKYTSPSADVVMSKNWVRIHHPLNCVAVAHTDWTPTHCFKFILFSCGRCYINASRCPDWSSPQLREHERGDLLGVFKYVLTGPSSQLHAVKTSYVQNIEIIFNLV